MTLDAITKTLVEVLSEVQQESGYDIPTILQTSCPLTDLEGFDSHMGIVSTGLVASRLKIQIPNNVNLFVSKDGRRRLTIKETATMITQFTQ